MPRPVADTRRVTPKMEAQERVGTKDLILTALVLIFLAIRPCYSLYYFASCFPDFISLCFSPSFLGCEEVFHLQSNRVARSSLKVSDFYLFGTTLKEPVKV